MGPSPLCHRREGEECETSVEHGLPLRAEPAGGHPPPLIIFMTLCLLHVNHSPTCKSNNLITPLEVVSRVFGNRLRLSKRGLLSTVVFTKHNLIRRIT